MNISRRTANKIHFFYDQILPPIIRDSKWLMSIPLKLMYKENSTIFTEFKNSALKMDDSKFSETYRKVLPIITRVTDLNEDCVDAIVSNIVGKTVLEVGCGKGYLAKKLAKKFKVTASDIIIDEDLATANPIIQFKSANIENLPFNDNEFDTVVCTHTLEHVQNIFAAIKNLKRVAKKRLIVVVPKQRPYKYTFDLHLHFFPYANSFLTIMNTNGNIGSCKVLGGDLFYIEDMKS